VNPQTQPRGAQGSTLPSLAIPSDDSVASFRGDCLRHDLDHYTLLRPSRSARCGGKERDQASGVRRTEGYIDRRRSQGPSTLEPSAAPPHRAWHLLPARPSLWPAHVVRPPGIPVATRTTAEPRC
jgi:hypothetical protein